MDIAEVKLDLFRKIDKLDDIELQKVYTKLIELLNAASIDDTSLSPEVKAALDEALEASEKGQVSSNEEVMQKTRDKYFHLFK